MKRKYGLIMGLLTMVYILICIIAQAQKTPAYVPKTGFWVLVSNVNNPDQAVVHCYNDNKQLIHEEQLDGKRLNLKKTSTLRNLQKILEKALQDFNGPETRILVDNDRLRITEYISLPGQDVCGTGTHTHGDHATILLTDAKVKTTTADGRTEIETYSAADHSYMVVRDGKTVKSPAEGAFWVSGTTHHVTNLGEKPIRFYIVQTKI